MKTDELLDRLQRHYIKPGVQPPGWTFVAECGVNGTFGASSRVDALAIGYTSTSGRLLVGHELKVSRADWRHELDQAGKADFWADNCHAWYVVAPSTEIVPSEEVPHGWGLMVPSTRTKTRMDIVVKAQVHAERVPSWEAVRSIFARLDTLGRGDRARALVDAREEARREHQLLRQQDEQRERLTSEQSARLQMLDRIERDLGQSLTWWGDEAGIPAEEFAAALQVVKAARAMVVPRHRQVTDHVREQAEVLLAGLGAFTEAWDGLGELTGRVRR